VVNVAMTVDGKFDVLSQVPGQDVRVPFQDDRGDWKSCPALELSENNGESIQRILYLSWR
jgi:hypothetical protein